MIFVFIMFEKFFHEAKNFGEKSLEGKTWGVQNFFGEKFWWALRA